MRSPPFAYKRVTSSEEALAVLSEHGDEAKLLAGGQSLVPLLNFRLSRPSCLIDIGRIGELDFIRCHDDGIAIGALTRQRSLEDSSLVRERCPLLHEAIGHVGHIQTRNRGTVGGSLAHADPAAELPAVMTALGASLRVRGPDGERMVTPDAFFRSYLSTAVGPTEMLVAVECAGWSGLTGSCFTEVCHRPGDFALVGAAAILTLDAAGLVQRVGLGLCGVGERPFDGSAIAAGVLTGQAADAAALREVGAQVASAVSPDTDVHAPAAYRRHLAGLLAFRSLTSAAERAASRRMH